MRHLLPSSSTGEVASSWFVLAGAGAMTVAAISLSLGAAPVASGPTTEAPSRVVQPVLVEPPGGPILWGFHAPAQVEIAADGRTYRVRHQTGQGALVRLVSTPGCGAGDLESARLSPAPATVTHHRITREHTAYVPDGVYAWTVTCAYTSTTTRLIVETELPTR